MADFEDEKPKQPIDGLKSTPANGSGVEEDPEEDTQDTEDGTIIVPIPSPPGGYGEAGRTPEAPIDPFRSPQVSAARPTPLSATEQQQFGGSGMATGELPNGYEVMGTYVVKDRHGQGGMGWVYRGEEIGIQGAVAIKTIKPSAIYNPEKARKLREEAQTVKNLKHDALVTYRNYYAPEQGVPAHIFVMEFIDGPPLKTFIRENGRLTVPKAILLLRRMAEGLQHAHELGVVHRDIAPDNVILPASDISKAKIIDFGIAQGIEAETNEHEFVGKVPWASPEQMNQFPWGDGKASDVYSLGLLLFYVAVGKPPPMGSGKDSASMDEAVEKRHSIPDLSPVPRELRSLLTKMLQPDPGERLGTMTGVLAELDVLEGKNQPKPQEPDRRVEGLKRQIHQPGDEAAATVDFGSATIDKETQSGTGGATWFAVITGAAVAVAIFYFAFFSQSGAVSQWPEGSPEAVLEEAIRGQDCTFAIARDSGPLAGRIEVIGKAPVDLEPVQRTWSATSLPPRAAVAREVNPEQCAALSLVAPFQAGGGKLVINNVQDGKLRLLDNGSVSLNGRIEATNPDIERELLLITMNGRVARFTEGLTPGQDEFEFSNVFPRPATQTLVLLAIASTNSLIERTKHLSDRRAPPAFIADLAPMLLADMEALDGAVSVDIAVVEVVR